MSLIPTLLFHIPVVYNVKGVLVDTISTFSLPLLPCIDLYFIIIVAGFASALPLPLSWRVTQEMVYVLRSTLTV